MLRAERLRLNATSRTGGEPSFVKVSECANALKAAQKLYLLSAFGLKPLAFSLTILLHQHFYHFFKAFEGIGFGDDLRGANIETFVRQTAVVIS